MYYNVKKEGCDIQMSTMESKIYRIVIIYKNLDLMVISSKSIKEIELLFP